VKQVRREAVTCTLGATVLTALLGCLVPASVWSADKDDAAASLLQADSAVDRAILAADVRALAPLLSQTFVHVHVGAALIDTKASELDSLPLLKDFYRRYVKSRVATQLYGTTGLVSAFIDAERNADLFPSVPPTVGYHQIRVYVQEHRRWKLAYQHTTWAVGSQSDADEVSKFIYDGKKLRIPE